MSPKLTAAALATTVAMLLPGRATAATTQVTCYQRSTDTFVITTCTNVEENYGCESVYYFATGERRTRCYVLQWAARETERGGTPGQLHLRLREDERLLA